MNSQTNPSPAWRPYADQVIDRLLAHRRARALAANPRASLCDSESDTYDLDGADAADELQADLPGADLPGNTDAATAEQALPPPRLSAPDLSLAIRLAATFAGEAAMQAACAPGAITAIHGLTPDELKPVTDILEQALLPAGTAAHRYLAMPLPSPGRVVILLASENSGTDTPISQRRFRSLIDEALVLDLPLILLLQDARQISDEMRRSAKLLRLAPLSCALLLAHLGQSHGLTRAEAPAIRAAMPPDQLLAALPGTALMLALRAPDAAGVAAQLARLVAPAASDGPRLEAMRGDSPALTAARRMIADLRDWKAGRIGWNELSRTLLLFGPPGTGKTHLARAMGNSAGIAMITGSFAKWQAAGHLGDMLREMCHSFAEARKQAPALLFIDEIDAVGSRANGDSHGSNYRLQVINAFLAEMDGIAREAGVILVGACNDPARIDPAALRPGRFDLRIAMPLPDTSMILGLLDHHLGNLFQKGEHEALARACTGQSAAAIDAAIRAARAEARHARQALTPALIRGQLGLTEGPSRDARDRRVAVHECGHAIVASALDRGPPTRVLITAEGGETHRRDAPHDGRHRHYQAELAVLLAGRAAERLILGEVSAGAGGSDASDLAQATQLALQIEMQSGLGLSGPVWSDIPAGIALREPAIHTRIRQRLKAAEEQAEQILTTHRDLLARMAAHLQQSREITGTGLLLWPAQVTPVQAGEEDDEGRPAASTGNPGDASQDASPRGLQGAPSEGSPDASESNTPHNQQAHPYQMENPHGAQDDPEITQGNPDPDQAI